MLTDLAKENTIIILPRDVKQIEKFEDLAKNNTNIVVPPHANTVDKIAENCDVFLGAGGSMTREFAMMGIPTVSMYQDDLLEVDKYLIGYGVLVRESDPDKIDLNFINQLKESNILSINALEGLHQKGQQAREIFDNLLTNNIN